MTPAQRKEEISKAYLHALAAINGFAVANWSQDHGCVDTTVSAAEPLIVGGPARTKIDVQLKATQQERVEQEDHISWKLEAAHYNWLVAHSICPLVLVVLLLPMDGSPSVTHSTEQLVIRRCAYWTCVRGQRLPEGQESKVVHLPKANVFSPDGLREMLTRVSKGDAL